MKKSIKLFMIAAVLYAGFAFAGSNSHFTQNPNIMTSDTAVPGDTTMPEQPLPVDTTMPEQPLPVDTTDQMPVDTTDQMPAEEPGDFPETPVPDSE